MQLYPYLCGTSSERITHFFLKWVIPLMPVFLGFSVNGQPQRRACDTLFSRNGEIRMIELILQTRDDVVYRICEDSLKRKFVMPAHSVRRVAHGRPLPVEASGFQQRDEAISGKTDFEGWLFRHASHQRVYYLHRDRPCRLTAFNGEGRRVYKGMVERIDRDSLVLRQASGQKIFLNKDEIHAIRPLKSGHKWAGFAGYLLMMIAGAMVAYAMTMAVLYRLLPSPQPNPASALRASSGFSFWTALLVLAMLAAGGWLVYKSRTNIVRPFSGDWIVEEVVKSTHSEKVSEQSEIPMP